MKIITRNIIDKTLNKRINNILNDNSNQNLLINLFIGKDTSNILIFRDKKDILVIPNENERKIFEEFYSKINFDDINIHCFSLMEKLLGIFPNNFLKKHLFLIKSYLKIR